MRLCSFFRKGISPKPRLFAKNVTKTDKKKAFGPMMKELHNNDPLFRDKNRRRKLGETSERGVTFRRCPCQQMVGEQ